MLILECTLHPVVFRITRFTESRIIVGFILGLAAGKVQFFFLRFIIQSSVRVQRLISRERFLIQSIRTILPGGICIVRERRFDNGDIRRILLGHCLFSTIFGVEI